MNCPRCQTTMLDEREREGVVIDVCSSCRGIWLDRGELEKLIARASRDFDDVGGQRRDSTPPRAVRYRDDDDHDRRDPRRKRRWYESFGDIFD